MKKECQSGLLFVAVALIGCNDEPNRATYNAIAKDQVMLDIGRDRDTFLNEPIRPLPARTDLNISSEMASLGNRLYHDTRLSGDNTLSCASCHNLSEGGDDGLQFSKGINGAIGGINAPTVLNSGFNFVQFWNGRAKDLQEQAAGPVANPIEMGADWDEVIDRLSKSKEYKEAFEMSFGDPEINRDRVTKAIAEFEKTLITPSAFDRYLLGERSAISNDAQEGYRLFKDYGCVSCHQGINVGGNLYQKFGAIQTYYDIKSDADKGRETVTKNSTDLAVFKVPSLRNIAKTAPYFHNGAALNLRSAIRIMGAVQLGKNLKKEEVRLISAFLESLSGDIPVTTVAKATERAQK